MSGSDKYVNQENYIDGDAKPSGGFIGQELLATNGNAWEWSGAEWFPIKVAGRTLANGELEKSAFGELSTAELTPIVQLNFNYNINTELVNELNNGGTTTVVNDLLHASSGAAANQSALLNSKVPIKYNSGQGIRFRSSGIFTTGVTGNTQLIGAGDSGDGLFFAYQGAVFGILRRRGGIPEARNFQITTGSGDAENVTVTLDGDTIDVAVTASGNATITANELGEADYSGVGRGWNVHVDGDEVEFFSYDASPRTGTYSLTATSAVATITQKLAGTTPTDEFVPQTEWNLDKADGTKILPDLDWTKGNVFQIQYQWLGFGLLMFSVENPSTGKYVHVHHIEYAGANILASLANPHLQLCVLSENTTNTTDIVTKVGSMGGFVEGRTNGTHFHNGVEGSALAVGTTETPIVSIHNKRTYVSKLNKIRIRLIFASVAADGNKNVTFRFKFNPTLINADFVEVESDLSIVEVDTSATLITEGDEQFTVGVSKIGSETIPLATSSFFLNPGDTVTITAQSAAAGTADVTCSFNWEELF